MRRGPLAVLAVTAFSAVLALGWAMRDPFEGAWKINAIPEAGGKPFADTLTFKGGKMTAAELQRKGWPPGDFDDDIRPGNIAQFTATLKHPKEGEMRWQGQVAASEIRGTIVWKNGDEETRYNFNGSKN